MKAMDLERMRVRRLTTWEPDFECADCLRCPTCPELTDELWGRVWRSSPPIAPRRCNCDAWAKFPRLARRDPVSGDGHYRRCDLARPLRRQLLCLECAERRLGRRVSLPDLKPCLGNYHAGVEAVRHGLTLVAVAREEFRTTRSREPVDSLDLAAVDARARALASGQCDAARIASAPTSVESLVVAATRAAMRELGVTDPDWSQSSDLWRTICRELPSLTHICASRRVGRPTEITLEAVVGGRTYEMPWPTLSPCDDLDEFFDGELADAARADAFRSHLGSCERCSRVLEGRMHELVAVSTTDEEARRALASLQRDRPTPRSAAVDVAIADAGILPWMECTAADLDRAIVELRRRRAALDSADEMGHVDVPGTCACPDGDR